MPAQSQQQQKLFGLALAFKRGEVPSSEVSDEIKAIADRMSEKDIEDFAATKHKGLPKMKEQLRKFVRVIIREKAISEMNEQSVVTEVTDSEIKKSIEKKERGGPYTIIARNGKKIVDHSPKSYDNVEDAIKMYHTYNKKHRNRNSVSIEDGYGRNVFMESVNEDTKKRFDVDFYNNDRSRTTSHEEIIRGDKFSDVVSQAIKIAKSKGMVYVEFYYKDAFIGSIDKRNGYEFKKGRSYQKSPLSVTEGTLNESPSSEELKIVMMAVRKIAKYRNVPIDQSINDVLNAAEQLERDIKKGKIKK